MVFPTSKSFNVPDELCQMQVKVVAKSENIRHNERKRDRGEREMLREGGVCATHM